MASGVNTFFSCLQTVLCLAICAEVCRPRPAQVVVVERAVQTGGKVAGGGEASLPLLSVPRGASQMER